MKLDGPIREEYIHMEVVLSVSRDGLCLGMGWMGIRERQKGGVDKERSKAEK